MCIELVNSHKKIWCRCKNCSLQMQQNMVHFLSKAEWAIYGKSTVFWKEISFGNSNRFKVYKNHTQHSIAFTPFLRTLMAVIAVDASKFRRHKMLLVVKLHTS